MIRDIPALAALSLALAPSALAAGPPTSHYQLEIAIDSAADIARVSGEWRIAPSDQPLRTLEFLLSPLASDPVLGARCGPDELPVAGATHADEGGDRRWSVLFDAICAPGNPVTLSFRYEYVGAAAPQLRLGRAEGFAGGGGELWYPQASFAEPETGAITIDVAEGLESVATGALRHEAVEDGRARTRFELAAPGKLAFAYGDYRIVGRDGTAVMQLARSLDVDPEAVADAVAQSVAALAAAFGPPPFHDLRVVEVDFRSQVQGTSEPGMLFVDSAQMREAAGALPYWSHELAHQWWGVSVRSFGGSPGAAMLTEGMAQYGALVALERVEGAEAAARYRLEGRGEDRAQSLAGYRALVAEGHDRPIGDFLPHDQAEALFAHRLATSKGAIAMSGFAERFGRDALHRTLQAFLERHRGGRTSWAELEAALILAFGAPANQYLRIWYHQDGWPE
jgi:hypothetical protein